jgi:hypothetical protein
MARVDVRSLGVYKQINTAQKAEHEKALARYHCLSNLHDLTNTPELKRELVNDYPIISAQMVYYLDDRQIGQFFMEKYSQHPMEELRELATHISNVMRIRSKKGNSLVHVLGMDPSVPHSEVPLVTRLNGEYDTSREGTIDNIQRAYEEYPTR